MFLKILVAFFLIFAFLLSFYSGTQYQKKLENQIQYITQDKIITVTPKDDLMKRCGSIPDEIPTYGHFDIVAGPFWSPDCRHIAWSVWESGTSFITDDTPIPSPSSDPDMKAGIYLYDYLTKKIEKLYAPKSRGETVTIDEWKDRNIIRFQTTNIPLLYDIRNGSTTFINKKLGYQFIYPKNWTLRHEDKSGELYMLYKSQGQFIEFQNEMSFELKPNQTIEDYLKYTPGFGGIYQETNISGYPAYIKKITGGEQGEIERLGGIFIKHNKKYLSIVFTGLMLDEIWPILNSVFFIQ